LPGSPEDKAREGIDRQLEATGWLLQDKDQLNLGAAVGVALRNFSLPSGPCDYLLFIDRKVAGVIEAKRIGVTLTGVSEQSARYMNGLPAHLRGWAGDRLVFGYESTGIETLFRDVRDPNSRSRNVFTFHCPQALHDTLLKGTSLRGRLAHPAPLVTQGLRDCQIEALNGLDASLARGDPKALIQMIMGAGKTFTACTASYRFIKHAGAKRILFLVDRNNLGRQSLREFQDFCPPDDGRKFTQLYNVQHLQSNRIDPDAKVVITTIQRLYAMLRGQELSVEDEDSSAFEGSGDGGSLRTVACNPKIPIDKFDVIITDECHRSIYGVWRQVLEYFDAHIIGLTATPSRHTLGYFNRNLISEYPYERSVTDGVNVGYEVFRVRTHVTEQGRAGATGPEGRTRLRATRPHPGGARTEGQAGGRWHRIRRPVTQASTRSPQQSTQPLRLTDRTPLLCWQGALIGAGRCSIPRLRAGKSLSQTTAFTCPVLRTISACRKGARIRDC
jgi:type I restriction enzyme R subunit